MDESFGCLIAIHFYVKGVLAVSPLPKKVTPPPLTVGSTNAEAKDLQARERSVHYILQASLQVSKKLVFTLQ